MRRAETVPAVFVRLQRSWGLVKASAAVLAADRTLLLFPVLSFAAGLLGVSVLAFEGLFLYASNAPDWAYGVLGALGTYVLAFVAVYFNVALAAAAARSLEGEDTTVREGLAEANARLGAIAGWALVSTVVSLVLSALKDERNPLATRMAARAGEVAWRATTFFVVPVLALEGVGVGEALRRSGSLFTRRWAEEASGYGLIGVAAALAALVPTGLLAWLGVELLRAELLVAGGVYLALAGVVVLTAAVATAALRGVFAVTLYRDAVTEADAPPLAA